MSSNGWIGVDLDGTLAHYDGWKGVEHIGAPVPLMLARVKGWLAEGKRVKVFTARVAGSDQYQALAHIHAWLKEHVGEILEVTCRKDFGMVELWDDRCVQVVPNEGRPVVEGLVRP